MEHVQRNRTVVIISLLTVLTGITVMVGWLFNIPAFETIVRGFEAMRFNSALCFVLLGSALLISQYSTRRYRNLFFVLLSVLATFIGLITVSQDLFHFNTGLDQLFVFDKTIPSYSIPSPGRMAFNASVNFLILGLGFLLLIPKKRIYTVFSQYFFHLVSILSAIALIGYLYGVSFFRVFLYRTSMATHTAILFFILSLAASLLNPSVGIAQLFTGKRVGNQMAKRLFTLMILMIIVFGSLRSQTQRLQLSSSLDIGASVLAVSFLLVSLLLIWNTANWLNKIDKRRSEAEEEVKRMNLELEKRVEERSAEHQKSEEKYHSLIEQASDAIYVLDINGNFIDVNESMCKMMGYSRQELLQLNVEEIIDPEELKTDPLPISIKGPSQSTIRERQFLRKDGSVFSVEVNVKRFDDDRTMVIARNITDRKKMEIELRDAELKFRTIADKSMVGVYIVQHGNFIYVNPRFAGIFGYQPEELTNTVPVEAIIDEGYQHITTENVRRRMEGEIDSVHYEALGKKKDGTTNWVEFYGSRAIIGGKPTIIGSMIDINERKKAEEELKTSEQKYKLLFESNPSPMWMIAKDDLSVIAVNDAAARLYGYTKDELLQMNVSAFRTEEDRKKQQERFSPNTEGLIEPTIVRHVKKDGSIMYVEIVAYDIVFEGRPVRLSLTNDITKKLKAEESLKKSQANLQTILNTTDTAYALFDLDLKMLSFNQKAIEFVKEQYDHGPEKGDQITDYFPPEKLPQFTDYIRDVLNGSNINFEIDYQATNYPTLWYYVRLFPITNDDKEILGVMMALYDITERKNAEQDLKNAYVRIQSHIDSIKEMAWKQSHLIRSPLANLKGLAAMLKDNPANVKVLDFIQNELDRMDSIIIEMADDASEHAFND